MIRFKVDENLPHDAVELLRTHGHDALSVSEQHLTGASDDKIASVCMQEKRALITLDLDFSDLRRYQPSQTAGIVVLRLAHQDKASIVATLTNLLPLLATSAPQGKLWIVEETQIRIRE
ncbi:MAG TPA: DUF5615 family PIN-like protein [Planctomycetota bacterium]|nr:DUF5615 family PIN-like protein [Planctomycetota bacterium]